MYDPNANISPVNPLPPVVVFLFLAIILIEGVFQLGQMGMIHGAEGVGLRSQWMQRFGFSSRVMDWMFVNRTAPVEHIIRIFTFPFIHAQLGEAIFASVFVLAFGKFVAEKLGQLAVLVIFFASSITAAMFLNMILSTDFLFTGAMPAAFGLLGAWTYLKWMEYKKEGKNPWNAFLLIAMLTGIQLLFTTLFGGMASLVTELVGFATGLLIAPLFDKHGRKIIKQAIRHD